MKKRSLSFNNLSQLAQFCKTLSKGHFINTTNQTITAEFSVKEIEVALDLYEAHLLPTSQKLYSYLSDVR